MERLFTIDMTYTDADVIDKVKALSTEDKYRLIHNIELSEHYGEIKVYSLKFIDWLEQGGLVNNYKTQSSRLEPILGMLNTIGTMLDQTLSIQTRHEMQCQSEETQWAMSIADAMYDKSNEVKKLANELASLSAHYSACLMGRRLNVNYIGSDGEMIPYTQQELDAKG